MSEKQPQLGPKERGTESGLKDDPGFMGTLQNG